MRYILYFKFTRDKEGRIEDLNNVCNFIQLINMTNPNPNSVQNNSALYKSINIPTTFVKLSQTVVITTISDVSYFL